MRQVWLNSANDYILAALMAASAFVEHPKALAHSRGVSEKYFEAAPGLLVLILSATC